jgi:hypothetical protein
MVDTITDTITVAIKAGALVPTINKVSTVKITRSSQDVFLSLRSL